MRVFLLAILLFFGVGGTVALADGMILPEAFEADYLAVRYHYVTVRIEDGHAVTRVEQEFYNPHPFHVRGRYLFPVPPDAILSNFAASVDGQAQQVIRQDPSVTNAALFAAVVERNDPSLLQYADWETLAFDLSLPPGASRHMILEYEEVLLPAGGLYRYHYVLSTERYSAQLLEHVRVTVDVRMSAGLANLYSPGYPLTVQWLGPGQAQATWEAYDARPGEDMEIFFAPSEEGFGGGLLTGQREGRDHFLFLFAPDNESFRGDVLPKDIVFVIDRSGSMGGEKIEQARSALHYALGRLDENDRFSIVSFDHQLSLLAPTLQPVEREVLAGARQYVDALFADGNTDLEAALRAGLGIFARSEGRAEAARILVFLTDGLPTAGITDGVEIARRVAEANAGQEARLHVFGVGYDVNTHLLDRLSADGEGTVTYVQPSENLEAVLTSFYDRIANPVLTDVTVEFSGMEVSELYPQAMPDLFQDSSVLLAGRYRATADTAVVRVRGRSGEQVREYIYHFDLGQVGGHDFVPQLWATRKVGALLDRVRVEGETPALVEEISALGLTYGIVTPYTTFVIEGQAAGVASWENMALYDQAALNQSSGDITVQARVQNQAYQQAAQANLARGANVLNVADASLAQIGALNVDLSLLQGQTVPSGPVTTEWIVQNVVVDRVVEFGSEEYFALARDPSARPQLQGGTNVVFSYQGKVVAVQTEDGPLAGLEVSGGSSGSSGWQYPFFWPAFRLAVWM